MAERRRYFDGRIRQVVSTRRVRLAGASALLVEKLECGHELSPTLPNGGHRRPPQFRVCHQCEAPR